MMIVSVPFRGDDTDIVVTADHGYEPDTNAHDIDWHFADAELNDTATDDELEAVLQILYQLSYGWHDDD